MEAAAIERVARTTYTEEVTVSKEALVEFRSRVEESSELQKAFRAASGGGKSWDWAALVALGEREGLPFSAEEARAFLNELDQSELSDFELELVAGGQGQATDAEDKGVLEAHGRTAARADAAARAVHRLE
jgi:hypothetical protein